MRAVTLILAILLLLLQYPLWIGKGSWLKVWDTNRQLVEQQQLNELTRVRNTVLDAEVRDLKQGTEAVEERARSELGMIKRDEVFYRILEDSSARNVPERKSSVQVKEKSAEPMPASAVLGATE